MNGLNLECEIALLKPAAERNWLDLLMLFPTGLFFTVISVTDELNAFKVLENWRQGIRLYSTDFA